MRYTIVGTYNGETEDIDEFETKEEATKMLAEYRLAYGAGWYLRIKQLGRIEGRIGCGSLGNGLTVWDRTIERNGDYKTLAHIQDNGEITWYCKRYKKGDREYIQELANKMKRGGRG